MEGDGKVENTLVSTSHPQIRAVKALIPDSPLFHLLQQHKTQTA